MDKDTVKLIISIEEHLQLLSQQIHEVKLIALATKDTLAQLNPKAEAIYEKAYAHNSRTVVPKIADLVEGYEQTIKALKLLL